MAANGSRLKGLSEKSADDEVVDCLLFLLIRLDPVAVAFCQMLSEQANY